MNIANSSHKISKKLSFKKGLQWYFALVAWMLTGPYFLWPTFSDVLSNGVAFVSLLICLSVTLFYLVYIKPHIFRKGYICGFLLVLLYIFMMFISTNNVSAYTIFIKSMQYFCIILFLLFPKETKMEIFEKFAFIFAITLIPSIIITLFVNVGISLPHIYLENPVANQAIIGKNFNLYFFAVNLQSIPYRLCGIYSEPGFVGTIAALILVGRGLQIRNNKINLILLTAGILSYSLAFVIILIVSIIIKFVKKKSWKKLVWMCLLIIIVIVFFSIDTNNETINYYQRRLSISEGTMVGDNRANSNFDAEFSQFVKSGGRNIIIGNGLGAAENNPQFYGSSEYRMLIYDYGYFGFSYMIFWIVFSCFYIYGKRKFWSQDMKILLISFLLSIYQRPDVFTAYYMIILFGGLAYLNIHNGKELRSD